MELLVDLGIEAEDAGALDGVAADVAELPGRRFDERVRIPAPRGRRVVEIRADAGRIRPVVAAGGGAGVVHAADSEVPRHAGLQRDDAARLPAADDRVRNAVLDFSVLPLPTGRSYSTEVTERWRVSKDESPRSQRMQ